MISFNLLRFLVKPSKIAFGLKHPRAALRVLNTTSVDIPRLCRVIGISLEEFNRYVGEVRENKDFNDPVFGRLKRYESHLKGKGLYPGTINDTLGVILYAILRFSKPDVVLETGVASGLSSSYILLAMEENKRGQLYSIDLPFEEDSESDEWASLLPKGEKSGWLIPQNLRHRWLLKQGRSSEVMSPLLEQLKSIDIFLHDSDHSYENMMWEYQAAWPYLKGGGLLLSHDIEQNNAFTDFYREAGGQSFTIYTYRFGGIKKGQA
jgi:predicted O-methyltransferase YrrM